MSLLNEERLNYSTRTIRRLWEGEGRPLYEQFLGRDLALELDARLDTSKPWAKKSTEDKDDFLCRLSRRGATTLRALDTLSKHQDIPYDSAVTALMLTAPNDECREVASIFKEFSLAQFQRLGAIELCDTMGIIHCDQCTSFSIIIDG